MTERGLLGLAGVVLVLQLSAARLPPWVPHGAQVPIALEGFAVEPPLERRPGEGLHLHLRCPAAERCRAEASVPVPVVPSGALVATGTGFRRNGGGTRVVLVDGAARFRSRVGDTDGPVLTAAPGARAGARLVVSLAGDGEEVELRDLRVGPALRSPLRVGLLTAWWVAAGALVAGSAGLLSRVPALVSTLAWMAPLVLAGMVMPSALLDAVLLSIPGATEADLGKDLFTEPTLPVLVQKVGGHGLSFTALGWVGAQRGGAWLRVVGWLLVLGVLTESLQELLPDRSGKVSDVAVDTLGAALGVGLSRLAGALRAPRGSAASPP